MRRLITSVLSTFTCVAALAQYDDLGTWNILNVKYTFNDKWSLFAEGQVRSLDFYSNFHYHEYKGALNYKLHPSVMLTLGVGDYDTYKEGGDFVLPKNNAEFRLWPQVTLFQSIGKLKLEQRYRAEFRFTSNGYRNRFRYRFGLALPFGSEVDGHKPFQISGSAELFFTDNEPYFERLRSVIAFNYRMSRTLILQMGYVHQFDYRINDETGRDFLQVGVFIELFHKRSTNASNEFDLKDN